MEFFILNIGIILIIIFAVLIIVPEDFSLLYKKNLMDQVQDAYLVIDDAGDIVACNKFAKEFYKAKKKENIEHGVAGTLENAFFFTEDQQKVEGFKNDMMQQIRQMAEEHSDVYYEQNEKVYKFEVSEARKKGIFKKRPNYLVKITDVTNIYGRLINQKLLKEEAQSQNEAKGNFLSKVSHEIRTPMNSIMGMVEVMLRNCQNAYDRECLLNIQNSSDELINMVEDLMDISQFESGNLNLEENSYDFIGELEEISYIVMRKIGKKPVELLYDLDAGLPEKLIGDAKRVRQIFLHLLMNAVNCTDQGYIELGVSMQLVQEDEELSQNIDTVKNGKEEIKITDQNAAETMPGRRIRSKAEPKKDSENLELSQIHNKNEIENDPNATTEQKMIKLSVHVKDSGWGLREEEIDDLFVTYQNFFSSSRAYTEGSGVSLPICKALIEAMGGEISVNSIYGVGTEIRFSIIQKCEDYTPAYSVSPQLKQETYSLISENKKLVHHFGKVIDSFGCKKIRLEEIDAKTQINHVFVDMDTYTTMKQLAMEKECISPNEETIEKLSKKLPKLKNIKKLYVLTHPILDNKMNCDIIGEKNTDSQTIYFPSQENKEPIPLTFVRKPFYSATFCQALSAKTACSVKQNKVEDGFVAVDAKILLVDDNEMNRTVVKALLEPFAIQIEEATNGIEAIKKIQKTTYDLVFMDHMMPVMDGIAAVKRIRKLEGEYYKNVPIIALSANEVGGMREEFLAAGMQEFVSKPIRFSVLCQVLLKWLPKDKIEPLKKKENIVKQERTSLDLQMLRQEPFKEALLDQQGQDQRAFKEAMFDQQTQDQRAREENAVRWGPDEIRAKEKERLFNDEVVSPNREILDKLKKAGLSVEDGIFYCAEESVYLEVLQDFMTIAEYKFGVVESCLEQSDLDRFTIEVHALKTSFRTIGQAKLSEKFLELEKLGRDKEVEKILELTPKVLLEARALCSRIRPVMGEEYDAEEAEYTELMKTCQKSEVRPKAEKNAASAGTENTDAETEGYIETTKETTKSDDFIRSMQNTAEQISHKKDAEDFRDMNPDNKQCKKMQMDLHIIQEAMEAFDFDIADLQFKELKTYVTANKVLKNPVWVKISFYTKQLEIFMIDVDISKIKKTIRLMSEILTER